MLEKDITAAIMRVLKMVPRCFAWKMHGGMYGTAGIPDVICCLDGRFFAFEVKTPDGRVTKLQERTIHKIKVAGGHASCGSVVWTMSRPCCGHMRESIFNKGGIT